MYGFHATSDSPNKNHGVEMGETKITSHIPHHHQPEQGERARERARVIGIPHIRKIPTARLGRGHLTSLLIKGTNGQVGDRVPR